MPKFQKDNISELKAFLYHSSDVHDAKIKTVEYNISEDILKIKLYNPIFKTAIGLSFHDVGVFLRARGDWHGKRDTVLALTVEEDFSILQNDLIKQNRLEDSLHLCFQMFSGEEWHIVSKEVEIEKPFVKDEVQ